MRRTTGVVSPTEKKYKAHANITNPRKSFTSWMADADLHLKARLEELQKENAALRARIQSGPATQNDEEPLVSGLSLHEYRRYGRQMIVPEFGALDSQLALKNASILVVGAGGLGCPALLYLSASGVGKIGIVDSDEVDVSNLHRQVMHATDTVGTPKVQSAQKYINRLNPNVKVTTYETMLTNTNAFDIVSAYDVVLDCTDNPATRYLINDVAVLCGKPIVSGSGLKTEGQLSVLNYSNVGPCYRCFYPKPPSSNFITSCKDGGVLGPCIGLVGVGMAVEAIKVLTGAYERCGAQFKPFLTMYSAYPYQQMRMFKMRPRQATCAVCGDSPIITRALIESHQIDYIAFCGKVNPNVLASHHRVTPQQYFDLVASSTPHILLDVRPQEQFAITALPHAIHIPWDPTLAKLDNIDKFLPATFDKNTDAIYVICRYGNDSQLATEKLHKLGFKHVKDIKGGLNQWSEDVDATIPIY
jgi:adenylyltransferase/sulfurtransferase